jgi:hypothetical protein
LLNHPAAPAAPARRELLLGSRMMRVTDATTRALLEHGCPLRRLKLTRSATDASLHLLADACPEPELSCSLGSTSSHMSGLSAASLARPSAAGSEAGRGACLARPSAGSSGSEGGDSEDGECGWAGLRELDLRRNPHVTAGAVAELALRCAPLALLRLPQRLACLQEQLAGEGWALKQAAAAKEWFELVR